MERWKPVENYEGLYEVSDLGRVRRVDSYIKTGIKHSETRLCKGRILKQRLKRNGYLTVDLSKEQKVKTISVHRLVAIAFCEKENEEKKVVNHKNANKLDNRAKNLEWTTSKENKSHAIQNGLYLCTFKKKIRCKQLDMIFEGSYKAAEYINNKYYGNSKVIRSMSSKIRDCCNGKQKIAYGFNWEYI